MARYGRLLTLLLLALAPPAWSGCNEPQSTLRPTTHELRLRPPNERFHYARWLSWKIAQREDVAAARLAIHTEDPDGDYLVVRLIPEGELFTAASEKDLRLWLYHETSVPPPQIQIVIVREL